MLYNLSQAASCFLCAVLALRYAFPLDGTEFMGGSVTGPILKSSSMGILLFLAALPLAFMRRRRISGLVMLLASVLCLPLYLYFAIPGPFRWLFRGQYEIPLQTNVVWEKWSIAGILAIVITISFGLRDVFSPTRRKG